MSRGIQPQSLNPYSIGIWSATNLVFNETLTVEQVLILILLEYGLRPEALSSIGDLTLVLILILLEYGLRLETLCGKVDDMAAS